MPDATVIHLGRFRSVALRGLILLGEIVVVPGLVLYAMVASGHAMGGLIAVFAWRSACILAHHRRGGGVPATCWFAFGLFLARTVTGLAVSSVSLYLLLPILLCAVQGLFFLASSLWRRPVLMRLAADYVEELPHHPTLRRLFAQLSALWGSVHLACAAVGVWAISLATSRAVAVTSGLGVVCTVTSVGGCIAWGLWRVARIQGLRISYADRSRSPLDPAAANASAGDGVETVALDRAA